MIFPTTRTKENHCTIERASDAALKKEEDLSTLFGPDKFNKEQ